MPRSQAVSLQDRDLALLRGLFECRMMTAKHIAALFFDGKRAYTTKRLQKLKTVGLIGERRRLVNEPSILFLTRKAFVYLREHGLLERFPSLSANAFEKRANVKELTLRHELEVMDVKAAFHIALADSEKFSISEFSTWPLLHEFQTSRPGYGADILVKPDGFIRIHEKEVGSKGFSYDCFLEVDRSSEKQDVLVNRAQAYLSYFRSGDFAIRCGGSRTDFKEFPFRVLLVLKTAERRNNIAERLIQSTPPILTQSWLTTFAEVMANPLGKIWIQPAGYREVVKGTRFYNEHPRRDFIYRRQLERDEFVETKIEKLRLLDE